LCCLFCLSLSIVTYRCLLSEVNSLPVENVGLKRCAVLTACMTFVLVWVVTSKGYGLAVPDWPNTYGYNMFFFPPSKWIGGIFFEHSHRLVASVVGLLTMILALWLFGRKSRPMLRWGGALFILTGLGLCLIFPAHHKEDLSLSILGLAALASSFVWPACAPSPRWLRVLGISAFAAVLAQGVLGGLRVTQLDARLGIFHATLAQLFLVLVSFIALSQTQFWRGLPVRPETDRHRLRFFLVTATGLVLGQLVLGATMRHQHAGLAIPDFPAAYGKIWPDASPAAVLSYNQNRLEASGENPITAFQIELQMAHRIAALAILVAVGLVAWRARSDLGRRHPLSRLALFWFGLVLTQAFLGAATIWTGKSADVATAHVACGALCLVMGGLVSIVSFRMLAAPLARCAVLKAELAALHGIVRHPPLNL
jgi:cytochrome c oxidase assembly protein subunit 15